MKNDNFWLTQIRQRVPELPPDAASQSGTQAAVLMAFTEHAKEPALILTRRSRELNSHPGEVAFPGGKRDDTDPDLAFTALRESEEEIALPPSQVELIGSMPSAVSRWGLQVTPFVGIIPHQIELVPNETEIDHIFRVPLRFFLEQPQIQYKDQEHEGVQYRIPGFRFDGQVIWGLTAYFIAEFCNRIFDTEFEYFRPTPVNISKGEAP